MKVSDFAFDLPAGAIAARPPERRDCARLLVIRRDGIIEHRHFSDLPAYMAEGDMLLLNNTKVFPARIVARKPTGGKIDILLVRKADEGAWEVLCRDRFSGTVTVGDGLEAMIWAEDAPPFVRPRRLFRFAGRQGAAERDIIWEHGLMPLPPYIKRLPDSFDRDRYQTVYAEKEGSIAAPTAGLHFTRDLLGSLDSLGVLLRTVTLHVGIGTFTPISSDTVEDHRMDPEHFEIEPSVVQEIREVKTSGRRVVAVGTTATRAVEAVMGHRYRPVDRQADSRGGPSSCGNGLIRGETDLFIYPGHRFRAVDSLITNFHLPRSTPLMLASAFCGRQRLMKAYNEAITEGYRFFSYGDAMLIS